MAARRYFGTDGVRGVFGVDLTEELVTRLGRAFATWSGGCRVLVGRDTRASGPPLEVALSEGLASGGSPVRFGGILPTPAVALLAEECGAVISASHNPPEYNGVKFFDADGFKLSDADEAAIEGFLEAPPADDAIDPRWPESEEGFAERYVELVCERFGAPLDGLRIACDSANGAMSGVAPAAFQRLGAVVTSVGNDPDGTNINVGCGATDLSLLARVVRERGLDFGVAFDGDGDRMLAVDASGAEVDGDRIVAILALHLAVEVVVVTAMTNLGFHRLMEERGIRVVTVDVGDRHVLAAMRREGALLGGEQSGHVVYLDGHTTGDGLVAALLLARAVRAAASPLADLAAVLRPFPQVRRDVPVRGKTLTEGIESAVARANAELEAAGRVLVRPSGTEPVVRILAEAESTEEAERVCTRISAVVATELG
ncbi:MAG: phosphoglucosamine mutase [Actinomycetota bacterium]|nr:phosphoglucosamine mutase [Actinomycetota bacterium]